MGTEFCHDRTLADHCIDACYSDPRPGKSQLGDGGDRQSICRATAHPGKCRTTLYQKPNSARILITRQAAQGERSLSLRASTPSQS
ncbi:hypothetical protein LC653_25385 [Nostoc sp. CHAB 5784]|uniref:hypothetical protein n=1 Tax=Nostoc mirabile TaxID=2907820 RepID=UPI001E5058BB|nr:hypothetical protein [Nostoc mirabile]MCC5667130.1 hypothetical protein [Nostoc mirabile CHAB5784]